MSLAKSLLTVITIGELLKQNYSLGVLFKLDRRLDTGLDFFLIKYNYLFICVISLICWIFWIFLMVFRIFPCFKLNVRIYFFFLVLANNFAVFCISLYALYWFLKDVHSLVRTRILEIGSFVIYPPQSSQQQLFLLIWVDLHLSKHYW